jgi:tetratricopeptide (TPR) repeat protein
LEIEKIKEAIDVFTLNVKFYPESGRAYASLGEAYMKAGNTELASKNFQKSLQLNPDNTTAKEMLEKMSAK